MLKLKSLITPSAMLAAFILAAAPSFGQERSHGRQNSSGQQSSGRSAERAQPRSEAPRQGAAPQVESRQQTPRAQPQQQQQVQAPRAEPQRQAQAPRVEPQRQAQAPRVESRQQAPRAEAQRQVQAPRVESRQQAPRAETRQTAPSPRVESRRNEFGRAVPRRDVIVPRGNSLRYSPRVYAPRSYYRPYVFRPRFSIGFGIFAGYPVPYTYSYAYPIDVYGYGAPRAQVMITPGASAYGGVALEITPFDADVFVDGTYAGRVEDFDGTTQPLTLTAGTHRIEVQAQGYEPMVVDVGVQPGQVIPYRGDLRPY